MQKLKTSILKEIKTFKNDLAGVLLTLLMPIILVVLITLIQESSFKKSENIDYKVLIIQDQSFDISSLSNYLRSAHPFSVLDTVLSKEAFKTIGTDVSWDFALSITKKQWEEYNSYFDYSGKKMFTELMGSNGDTLQMACPPLPITYSPKIPPSFYPKYEYAISGAINNFEMEEILEVFYTQMEAQGLGGARIDMEPQIKVVKSTERKSETPNSVQHNVPAWSVFAIFFIIIPLSTSIINEKHIGVFKRILMIPNALSYWYVGKITSYVLLACVQFGIIWCIGLFIFPLIGLPELGIQSSYFILFLGVLSISVMAISFGMLIAAVFKSVQQAGAFGAISIILFAALGGIWIPSFLLGDEFQVLSKMSPLNWSLELLYDIILKDLDILSLFKYVLPIFAISTVINLIALKQYKKSTYE